MSTDSLKHGQNGTGYRTKDVMAPKTLKMFSIQKI
jgi:hypothetical protein